MPDMRLRRKRLRECVAYHGHLCMGQVLGVLIAERGMELIGTDDPHGMIVVSENDRCVGDALQIVTGTRLGRRSFKLRDYGKMAATFLNIGTGKAFRVWLEQAPVLGGRDFHSLSPGERQKVLEEVLKADTGKLLGCEPVIIRFSANELPGRPKERVDCAECGERVMDGKHVVKGKKKLCIACARGPYYRKAAGVRKGRKSRKGCKDRMGA
jgi:formylmethanofuran dehydrogenase subunit E